MVQMCVLCGHCAVPERQRIVPDSACTKARRLYVVSLMVVKRLLLLLHVLKYGLAQVRAMTTRVRATARRAISAPPPASTVFISTPSP
jgi:hypothetical protein